MKIGAEPRKIAILGVLILVGAYSFYTNVLSNATGNVARSAPPAPAAPDPIGVPAPAGSAPNAPRAPSARGRISGEFRPSLKPRTGEDRVDPTTIDPTLRLDLLAKLGSVGGGGSRNIFQFGTPASAEAKVVEPKIIPKLGKNAEDAKTDAKPASAATPAATPIALKYYGYSSHRGGARKRAFFLDGEDILVAAEGETVKKRYKVVRIGVSSVVMEDLDSKDQQTLPLQEDAVG